MKRCFWKKKKAPPRCAGGGPWAHPVTGTAPSAHPATAAAEDAPQAEAARPIEDGRAAAARHADPPAPEKPDLTANKLTTDKHG